MIEILYILVDRYTKFLVDGLEHDFYFPFHTWDVIRNPLTNSIIFKMVETTNQSLSQVVYLCIFMYIHVYI